MPPETDAQTLADLADHIQTAARALRICERAENAPGDTAILSMPVENIMALSHCLPFLMDRAGMAWHRHSVEWCKWCSSIPALDAAIDAEVGA